MFSSLETKHQVKVLNQPKKNLSAAIFSRKNEIPILFLLVLVTFLLYYRCLDNFFSFDDYWPLNDVKQWKGSLITNIFFAGDKAFFEPLSNFYWFACFKAFKLNPFYYHLTSIIIQSLACFLVFLLSRNLGFNNSSSALAAFLYTFFSSYHEAIYHITCADTLLQTITYLLAVIIFTKWRRRKAFFSKAGFFTIAALALAFLSKQSAITIVAILVWLEILYFFFKKSENPPDFAKLLKILVIILLSIFYFIISTKLVGVLSHQQEDHQQIVLPYSLGWHGWQHLKANFPLLIVVPFSNLAFSSRDSDFDNQDIFWKSLPRIKKILLWLLVLIFSTTFIIISKIRYATLLGLGWMITTLSPFLFWKHELIIESTYAHLPSVGLAIILSQALIFFKERRFFLRKIQNPVLLKLLFLLVIFTFAIWNAYKIINADQKPLVLEGLKDKAFINQMQSWITEKNVKNIVLLKPYPREEWKLSLLRSLFFDNHFQLESNCPNLDNNFTYLGWDFKSKTLLKVDYKR